MEKFHKDGNKIKSIKPRKGIPLFINFCYNQKIRYNLENSKLFVDENGLHYHEKHTTGGETGERIDSSVQYTIKKITKYNIENDKIIIFGEIERIKNGNPNTKQIIDRISLYRIYSDEKKLIDYLKNNIEQ